MKLSYNDAKHVYRIDGRQVKSVTAIAGIPDDKTLLNKWAERMVGIGIAENPDLAKKIIALKDKPWEANGIAWAAKQRAGGDKAADRGTQMHQTIEFHVKGILSYPTPYERELCATWDRALKNAGLEVLPEYTERIVVFPDEKIAGRLDHIVKVKRSGKVAVADLKSGKRAVEFPHAISVQLGTYANAPLMAGELDEDGITETFGPMPAKLDKKWAYIVHMPDERTVSIVKVDIAKGWDIAKKHCFPILDWRKYDDLVVPVVSQTLQIDPETDEPIDAPEDRVAWIRGRLADLKPIPGAREAVIGRWPVGVAAKPPWTDGDIDAIDAALEAVEKDKSAGFPVVDPAFTAAEAA